MPYTPFIKKEALGWSVGNACYRVRKPGVELLFFFADRAGDLLFFLRKRRVPAASRSILVIQLDHIGDMILCTPLIANIRRVFPDARLSLLIRECSDPIARTIEGVDEVLHLHTPWLSREKNVGWTGVMKFCLRRFRKYDLSFEVHGEVRTIVVAWLLSRFRVGFGVRGGGFLLNCNVPWGRDYSKHIVEVQRQLLESVAAGAGLQVRPGLRIGAAVEEKAASLLKASGLEKKGYIFIQMSAGETNREWPLHYWKNLIAALLAKGFSIVCADQDVSKKAAVSGGLDLGHRLHFFRVSLVEYTIFVKYARCVISIDTFCNHLASCFNTPALALYSGVNFTAEWGPLSDEKIVLQNTACSLYPCALRRCPFDYPSPCMQALSVESAIDSLTQLLGLLGRKESAGG
jgi:ADP-heptose:LPS heptosyltransferase